MPDYPLRLGLALRKGLPASNSRLIIGLAMAANYTTPADEAHFAAIGRLTISWAQLESGIDVTVMLLHHSFGGRNIEKEIPWSLQRKTKYIRRCMSRLEWLEPIAPAVQRLMSEIEKASEFRHDVIHGFAIDHPEGVSEVRMMRLLRGSEPFARKEFRVTTAKILREAVAAGELAGRALKLAIGLRELIDIVGKEAN